MNEPKHSSFAGPLVIILFTSIYGYWVAQRELVSSRPSVPGRYDVPDPVPNPGSNTAHSRIWQDPLSTAYADSKRRGSDLSGSKPLTFQDKDLESAVSKALGKAADVGGASDPLVQEHFRSLVDGLHTVCLPVFVSGGPYAEDKEQRMRIRYAVTAALAESGYHLKYSRRMSYVQTRISIRVLRGWQERDVVVPVKLYRGKGRKPQVLVLWINEEELGLRPLLATHRILNRLFGTVQKPENLDVSMIGPATSGTLEHMALEIAHINGAFQRNIFHRALLHPSPTGSARPDPLTSKADDIFENAETIEKILSKHGLGHPGRVSTNVDTDTDQLDTDTISMVADKITQSASALKKLSDERGSDLNLHDEFCSEIIHLADKIGRIHLKLQRERRRDSDDQDEIREHATMMKWYADRIAIRNAYRSIERKLESIGNSDSDSSRRIEHVLARIAAGATMSFYLDIRKAADTIRKVCRASKSADPADGSRFSALVRKMPELVDQIQDPEIDHLIKLEAAEVHYMVRESRLDVAEINQLLESISGGMPPRLFTVRARELGALIDEQRVRPNLVSEELSEGIWKSAERVEQLYAGKEGGRYMSVIQRLSMVIDGLAHDVPAMENEREPPGDEKLDRWLKERIDEIEALAIGIDLESRKIEIETVDSMIRTSAIRIKKYVGGDPWGGAGSGIAADAEAILADANAVIRRLGRNTKFHSASDHWHIGSYGASARSAGGLGSFLKPFGLGGGARRPMISRIPGYVPLMDARNLRGSKIHLYSPRATKESIDFPKNEFIALHRVIGTDRQLAEALRVELERRGALPGKIVLITEHDTEYGRAIPLTFENALSGFNANKQRFYENRCIKCHGPVLQMGNVRLDLRDEAGKAFRELESSAITCKFLTKEDANHAIFGHHDIEQDQPDGILRGLGHIGASAREEIRKWAESDKSTFHKFWILRGIDGKLPGDDAELGKSSNQASMNGARDGHGIVERPPEGRTQYDYLKRLRERIRNIEEGGDVSAIGVIGSDVYDKLLVLRALKPHFPNSVFFTTDLDAIYTHSDERGHTRNLLVASHYDLALGNQLQKSTPPFRDSYQTATFLAVSLAIARIDTNMSDPQLNPKWSQLLKHWWRIDGDAGVVNPVLHIVGKDGFYSLEPADSIMEDPPKKDTAGEESPTEDPSGEESSAEDRVEALLHPAKSTRSGAWHLLLVLGFSVVLALFVWAYQHRNIANDSPLFREEMRWGCVRCGIGALLVLGICLLLVYSIASCAGDAPFFSGINTHPRNLLLVITGIAAVISFAFLMHRFLGKLEKISKAGAAIALRKAPFNETDIARIGVIAILFLIVGTALVGDFGSHGDPSIRDFLLTGVFLLLLLAVVFGIGPKLLRGRNSEQAPDDGKRTEGEPEGSGFEVTCKVADSRMGPATRTCQICVFALLAFGIVAHLIFRESMIGWHPVSTSRHLAWRIGDSVVIAYSFGAVGLLLSAFLYLHLRCREVFNDTDALEIESGRLVQGTEGKLESERLWAVGKLTSASSRLALVMVALQFMLVIAYHPLISPAAMPLGLLVVTSISTMVFVLSAFALRWHFGKEREQALSELQWTLGCEQTTEDQKPVVKAQKQQIEDLSEGVFRPLNRSPIGWVVGGGVMLGLVDLWVRWWAMGQ